MQSRIEDLLKMYRTTLHKDSPTTPNHSQLLFVLTNHNSLIVFVSHHAALFIMIIHTVGASGSGTTTTGKALAEKLGIPCYDGDDYFWLEGTAEPYSVKRDEEERDNMLLRDMAKQPDCVVAGSMPTWSNKITSQFDCIVFLELPLDVRMARLRNREEQRYGDTLRTDPAMGLKSENFLSWAESLSYPHCTSSRGHDYHLRWLDNCGVPVLKLGDMTVDERVDEIIRFTKSTSTIA
ncbi:hypothetical protein B0I72DRAFT_140072, partial [Yarrowia lipolytica]|jgi:adenylate kinase family enzyme|uniref:YALI0E33011p n=2 Tax=Yarrowia lipolytica TaxID=4952 RepID=Q6C3Q3_YARLI|eukprot:XP_504709.1 YALI0E33011p [Yarrowia lipolytica CLIB122]